MLINNDGRVNHKYLLISGETYVDQLADIQYCIYARRSRQTCNSKAKHALFLFTDFSQTVLFCKCHLIWITDNNYAQLFYFLSFSFPN